MLIAEVSLYPVENPEADEMFMESLKTLDDQNLHYDIGSFSTSLSGTDEQVWAALRNLYERAQTNGQDIVMVVTVSNST